MLLRVSSLPQVERLDLAQHVGHVVGAQKMKAEAHDVYPILSEDLVAERAVGSALP